MTTALIAEWNAPESFDGMTRFALAALYELATIADDSERVIEVERASRDERGELTERVSREDHDVGRKFLRLRGSQERDRRREDRRDCALAVRSSSDAGPSQRARKSKPKSISRLSMGCIRLLEGLCEAAASEPCAK